MLAPLRERGGTADAAVSKTAGGDPVWVRFPPLASAAAQRAGAARVSIPRCSGHDSRHAHLPLRPHGRPRAPARAATSTPAAASTSVPSPRSASSPVCRATATSRSTSCSSRPTGRPPRTSTSRSRPRRASEVDRWHEAALAAGGRDNGAPGERQYHPGYYAAYVLDPDGNNIEAVHHGEGSAPRRRSRSRSTCRGRRRLGGSAPETARGRTNQL